MAMGRKNCREFSRLEGFRAKEQTGHEETGYALEVNFFYGKARAFDFAMNDWIQGGFPRHWPKAVCHEEAKLELLRSVGPFLSGCWGDKGKKSVEILRGSGSVFLGDQGAGKKDKDG